MLLATFRVSAVGLLLTAGGLGLGVDHGAAGAAETPLGFHAAAPATITATRAGAVRLGATYISLRRAGLVGKIRPGCPLQPGSRYAPLRKPLTGAVELSPDRRHTAQAIFVGGGGAARGVRIGATIADIRHAFPAVKIDRSTEAVFGISLASVPKRGGGPIDFAVSTKTGKVNTIAIPRLLFCD